MKRLAVCLLPILLALLLSGCAGETPDSLMATAMAPDLFTKGGSGGIPAARRTPTPGQNPAQRIAEAEGDMFATQTAIADQQRQAANAQQAREAGYTATAFAIQVAESGPVQTAGAELAAVIAGQARLQATQMGEQATAVVWARNEQATFERQQRLAMAVIEQDNAKKAGERIGSIWTVLLYATIVLALVVVVSICVLVGDRLSHRKRMYDAEEYKAQAEADQLNVMYTEDHTLVKDADGIWHVAGPRPENQQPTATKAEMGSLKLGPRIGRLTWFLMRAVKVSGRDAHAIPSRNAMGVSPDYWTAITDMLVEGDWIPRKQNGKDTVLWAGDTLGRLLDEVRAYENSPTPEEDDPKTATGQVATG